MSNFNSLHPRSDKSGQFVSKPVKAKVPTVGNLPKPVQAVRGIIPANDTPLEVDDFTSIDIENFFEPEMVKPGMIYRVCSNQTDSLFRDAGEAVDAAYNIEDTFGRLGDGFHPEIYGRMIGPWSLNWDIDEAPDIEYVYWVYSKAYSRKFTDRNAAANFALDMDEEYGSVDDDSTPNIKRRAMTKWAPLPADEYYG